MKNLKALTVLYFARRRIGQLSMKYNITIYNHDIKRLYYIYYQQPVSYEGLKKIMPSLTLKKFLGQYSTNGIITSSSVRGGKWELTHQGTQLLRDYNKMLLSCRMDRINTGTGRYKTKA